MCASCLTFLLPFLLSFAGILSSLIWLDDPCLAWSQNFFNKTPYLIQKIIQTFSWLPSLFLLFFLLPLSLLINQQNLTVSLTFALSVIFTLGSALILKLLFLRLRPQNADLNFFSLNASFPSIHVAGSSAAALALNSTYPALAKILFGLVILVALSRLLLKQHFLSDLFGGIFIAQTLNLFFTQSDFWPWLGLP